MLTWWQLFKRGVKHLFQKLTRGFSDDETWNLDRRLAANIAPRLRLFKQLTHCSPMDISFEEWHRNLDQMIFSMEYLASDYEDRKEDEETWNKVQAGCELFGRYLPQLWW
jgi:hypothetical protein